MSLHHVTRLSSFQISVTPETKVDQSLLPKYWITLFSIQLINIHSYIISLNMDDVARLKLLSDRNLKRQACLVPFK